MVPRGERGVVAVNANDQGGGGRGVVLRIRILTTEINSSGVMEI